MSQTRRFDYDAVGNTVMDARYDGIERTLSYGDNNRLILAAEDGKTTAQYRHNTKGQRVVKLGADQIHFHYGLGDQLMAETDTLGQTIREYLYVNGQRIAMSRDDDASIYYLHNDHLGTAQSMTDGNQRVVWTADYFAFGGMKEKGAERVNLFQTPNKIINILFPGK